MAVKFLPRTGQPNSFRLIIVLIICEFLNLWMKQWRKKQDVSCQLTFFATWVIRKSLPAAPSSIQPESQNQSQSCSQWAKAAIFMIGRNQNMPLPIAFTPTATGSATLSMV